MNAELERYIKEFVALDLATEISTSAGAGGYLSKYAFGKKNRGVEYLKSMGWKEVNEVMGVDLDSKVSTLMGKIIPKTSNVSIENRESIRKEIEKSLGKIYKILDYKTT